MRTAASTPAAVAPSAAPTPDKTIVRVLPDMMSARRQAAVQQAPVQVAASGTPTSQTWVNPNGSLTTETFPQPEFRRSGAGRDGADWVPLSGAVSGAGSATDPLSVAGMARPVTLAGSATRIGDN